MKKYHIILGMFCLLAGTACSDDDPVVKGNNGNQTEEELPPLPTEVITGSRAMWVSYDPTPNADANNSSGISSALISWRLLKTDGRWSNRGKVKWRAYFYFYQLGRCGYGPDEDQLLPGDSDWTDRNCL